MQFNNFYVLEGILPEGRWIYVGYSRGQRKKLREFRIFLLYTLDHPP